MSAVVTIEEYDRLKQALQDQINQSVSRGQEVGKLRDAIRRAGFGVCETSGNWTIHDVSEHGKREEERHLRTINENVDLTVKLSKINEGVEAASKEISEATGDELQYKRSPMLGVEFVSEIIKRHLEL